MTNPTTPTHQAVEAAETIREVLAGYADVYNKNPEYRFQGRDVATDLTINVTKSLIDALRATLSSPVAEVAAPVLSMLVNELVEQGQFFKRGDIDEAAFISAVNHYVNHLAASRAPVAVGVEPNRWIDGAPPKPWADEWFIARLTNGEGRVVLRALPKEYSYDFTTVDHTYYTTARIKCWMQFPDSQFIPATVPAGGGEPGMHQHWHHKSNPFDLYTVLAVGKLQTAEPAGDMTEVVVYRGPAGVWVRPKDEFLDGRFHEAAESPDDSPGLTDAEPLSSFSEGQWWVEELDKLTANGTDDQKRAMAVVRHLLKSIAATGGYEFDDEDLQLVKKLRYALEQYDNGDPLKDFLDEDELIEAGQLLLNIIDATQPAGAGVSVGREQDSFHVVNAGSGSVQGVEQGDLMEDAARMLRKYHRLRVEVRRGDSYWLNRILEVEAACRSIASHPAPAEKVVPVAEPVDAAGQPKQPLTVLESMAVNACNRVKAWAESDRSTPFPEEAHMLADGVLMMAAQRRKGVQ